MSVFEVQTDASAALPDGLPGSQPEEAALIYLGLRRGMKLVEALLLALLINAASFAVGLLLYF